ncbi:MAG: hypothetical protein ABW212_14410 [Pseudonocardia sediminis]
MDPSSTFYQTLTSVSFTLLGLWLTVMQLSHGSWRSDPGRHRATLHIGLHFFLPGLLGLFSLLGSSPGGSLLWRTVFVVGGLIGVLESLSYLRSGGIPHGRVHRTLSYLDPLLYAAVIVAAFLPKLVGTPLQVEGFVVGLIFGSGLCSAWLALSERARPTPTPVAPAEAGR